MLGRYLENIRDKTPLVHCITNYVTVNDVANVVIACGGSPIMSDDMGEVADITSICNGLDINIGTLNSATIPAMMAAGRRAAELGHPIVLDPVGAGASLLRTKTAADLLTELPIAVIRGNISEIKALAGGVGTTKGVDADVADIVTEGALVETISFAQRLSQGTGALVAISGTMDIVADADRAVVARNGHPLMARITGSGCMLAAVVAAYAAANPDDLFEATVAAICGFGICGQRAAALMAPHEGNASFRTHLIDAVYNLDAETLDGDAVYESR